MAVTARPYRDHMLGQITIQLAELRRAELLADATSHRTARARTTITARLAAATPLRRRAPVEVDVRTVACCTPAA